MAQDRQSLRLIVLTGAAAAILVLSGLSFVVSPGARRGSVALGGGSLRTSPPHLGESDRAGLLVVALPLATLGALAAAARRQPGRQKSARCVAAAATGVLTTDDQGRFRFATGSIPSTALTESTSVDGVRQWNREIGATLPLCEDGMLQWDPVGFSTGENASKFNDYRRAELKHGRVAMLATLGLIVQHTWRFQYLDPELRTAPSGIKAITESPTSYYFGTMVLVAGILEMGVLRDDGREPGDFGDPLGFQKESKLDVDEKFLKTYELEHGRLAMLGFMGTLAAEYTTGYDAVDQWANARAGWLKLCSLTAAAWQSV